jgi:hypothetical protein
VVAGVVVLACCGALGLAAASSPRRTAQAGAPITKAEVAAVKAEVEAAISLEKAALLDLGKREDTAADQALASSESDLQGAKHHEVIWAANQSTAFNYALIRYADVALWDDRNAVIDARHRQVTKAEQLIDKALPDKRAALVALSHIPTGTPPPTTSSVQACAFVASQSPTAGATIDVKVTTTTGSTITVTIGVGGATQSKTGTVGSTGSVYIGPFGPYPDATPQGAGINVNASNPTSGQTQSLPLTYSINASTAPTNDCPVHK